MGRKQKHPEHENLERWLISYADFITLLFATFVVLYALSQTDIANFQKLEESIKKAFASPSIMQGNEGLLEQSDNIFDAQKTDAVITPLMMEYMSQKYEEQSYNEIQKDIEEMQKSGELEGVETEMTERGLIVRFSDDYLFKSGSAVLMPSAETKLDKVGAVISKRFILHYMRIEGHTDNQQLSSLIYPSNWELSSARASSVIRHFIKRFSFNPGLFTAVGFADTRPLMENSTAKNKAKNRRVEILILKNQFKAQENPQINIMKISKKEQEDMQQRRLDTVSKIKILVTTNDDSAAHKQAEKDAQMLNKVYKTEEQRLKIETNAFDKNVKTKITGQGDWLKPPAVNPPNKKVIDIKGEITNEFR